MRVTRLAPLLAALAVLSACADPVQPSGRQIGPEDPRFDGGLYMGSGTSATPPASAAATSLDESRGSGYLGNGH